MTKLILNPFVPKSSRKNVSVNSRSNQDWIEIKVEFIGLRKFPAWKIPGYIANTKYIQSLHLQSARTTGTIPHDECINPWQVLIGVHRWNNPVTVWTCIERLESRARASNYAQRAYNLIEIHGRNQGLKKLSHSGWDYYNWDYVGRIPLNCY